MKKEVFYGHEELEEGMQRRRKERRQEIVIRSKQLFL
jgi:hypothetical protein